MKNIFIALLLIAISTPGFSQTDEIKINSKIEHVTVFLSGAQIERQAQKSLKPKPKIWTMNLTNLETQYFVSICLRKTLLASIGFGW